MLRPVISLTLLALVAVSVTSCGFAEGVGSRVWRMVPGTGQPAQQPQPQPQPEPQYYPEDPPPTDDAQ